MLDLTAIDLADLAMALEDHSADGHGWYVSRVTGEVRFVGDISDDDEADIGEGDEWVWLEPIPSHEAYQDMADFIALVADRRAAELLGRAIEGRGAFRRFKDTLFEFDELRTKWFAFHDARMRRRAIDWLADHDLIDDTSADAAMLQHPDPPVGDGSLDIDELARRAAEGLRLLYGPRLRDVRMFGSHARGEAGSESDLDLLIVLDRVDAPFEELRRMDDLLWRLTEQSGVTVSAFPVAEASLADPRTPTLIRAKQEAVDIL